MCLDVPRHVRLRLGIPTARRDCMVRSCRRRPKQGRWQLYLLATYQWRRWMPEPTSGSARGTIAASFTATATTLAIAIAEAATPAAIFAFANATPLTFAISVVVSAARRTCRAARMP